MTTNTIFLPSGRCLALLHRFMTVALVAALAVPAFVNATEPSTWIGTWSASPQPTWGADFAFPTNIPATLQEQTIRQVARISLGGKRIRIVIDFDALARDPAHPARLKPDFDSGDHLHPGDRGNKAMADAVELDALFEH